MMLKIKKNVTASVQQIHNFLIELSTIKDFYTVRTQLCLLIVVFAETYLPPVINRLQTWGIKSVLSKYSRLHEEIE